MITRLGLKGNISIHAAREGGDRLQQGIGALAGMISIHAAREGGDKVLCTMITSKKHFNPRRP